MWPSRRASSSYVPTTTPSSVPSPSQALSTSHTFRSGFTATSPFDRAECLSASPLRHPFNAHRLQHRSLRQPSSTSRQSRRVCCGGRITSPSLSAEPFLQAPYVNGLQYFSIARIESLAYVYPWDFAQWQLIASFFIIPVAFVMVEESLKEIGLALGGWANDASSVIYRCEPTRPRAVPLLFFVASKKSPRRRPLRFRRWLVLAPLSVTGNYMYCGRRFHPAAAAHRSYSRPVHLWHRSSIGSSRAVMIR